MKTRNVAVLLVLCALGAHAQPHVIHACRDARGGRVYQDAPCTGGLREEASRLYDAPAEPPDAARRLASIDREVHAGWERDRWPAVAARRRSLSRAMREDGRDVERRRCRLARAEVDHAARSRRFQGDRTALEESAVDACFSL